MKLRQQSPSMARPPPESFLFAAATVASIFSSLHRQLQQNDEMEFLHKSLWPLDIRDYVAAGLGALALVAAALGGVGGGGILLPIYILVMNFHVRQAVALSNITILGGAIANVAFAAHKRHPFIDRPLIAWDLILLFEPVVIFGTVIGSFLNKLLPDVVLQIILVLLYGFMSYETISKGLDLVKEEGGWSNVFRRQPSSNALSSSVPSGEHHHHHHHHHHHIDGDPPTATVANENGSSEESKLLPSSTYRPIFQHQQRGPESGETKWPDKPPMIYHTFSSESSRSGPDNNHISDNEFYQSPGSSPKRRHEVVQQLRAKEAYVQWWKPAIMTFCFAGMAALRIGQKMVSCASVSYWVLTLGLIPWVLPFFIFARRHVLRDFRKKRKLRYPFPPGDVHWTRTNTVKWPLVCSAAGIMSSMLGSSGGTIKAPLLLEMGTPPTVTAGTVAQMILFTSASSSLALIVFGLMPLDYGTVLFIYGMLCTAVTNWAAGHLLIGHGRNKQSLAMLSIAAVISLSTITMGIQSAFRIAHDPSQALRFGRLCDGRR